MKDISSSKNILSYSPTQYPCLQKNEDQRRWHWNGSKKSRDIIFIWNSRHSIKIKGFATNGVKIVFYYCYVVPNQNSNKAKGSGKVLNLIFWTQRKKSKIWWGTNPILQFFSATKHPNCWWFYHLRAFLHDIVAIKRIS